MKPKTSTPVSSLIISTYNDDVALDLILQALTRQTVSNFEIIVSEDAEHSNIADCVARWQSRIENLHHLHQADDGFRKNIALNRAIRFSHSEHLIFIDGDCVPHPGFIQAHQACAMPGIVCTGRRLELGKTFSAKLRSRTIRLGQLNNRFLYFLNMPGLMRDNAKNIESGLYSRLLQKFTTGRDIRLLGCNFSCQKQDLYTINGFNEDYRAAGIGEDSDIDWRLRQSGIQIRSVKFSAIQYHLYHPRTYSRSEKNEEIFNKTKEHNIIVCKNGLNK